MAMGFALDARLALLVMVRDETSFEEDHAHIQREMRRLDAAGLATKLSPVVVLVTQPDTPAPPAAWRKRSGETAKQAQAPTLFCLVTSSAVLRGVMTAVQWLSPSTLVRQ